MSTSKKVTTLVDTSTNWTFGNDILPSNYLGLESDTGFMKLGDGVTHWSSLDYVGAEVAAGEGTANFVPKFDADGNLADSQITDDSSGVTINPTAFAVGGTYFNLNPTADNIDINASLESGDYAEMYLSSPASHRIEALFRSQNDFGMTETGSYYNQAIQDFISFCYAYNTIGAGKYGGIYSIIADTTSEAEIIGDLIDIYDGDWVNLLAQFDTASNANQSSLLVEHNGVLKRLKFETAAGGKRALYIDE